MEDIMGFARRQLLHLAAGASALCAASQTVWAQTYPARPIRLLVPFAPGGAFDTIARPWADKMRTGLGAVVIENQGGGAGSLAAAAVAHARPDGYTILLGGSSVHLTEMLLKSRPLYDPVKDLEPIEIMAVYAMAIAVHPSVPVYTLKDLIDYTRANPGKLSYGSPGAGTMNHLTGELLKSLATIPDLPHIPYRGSGPALVDAVSGQLPVMIPAVTGQVLDLYRSGKLRLLAATNPTRLALAPDVPTVAEAGFPGLTSQQVIGLFAPTGTPRPIIAQISEATHLAMADPEYRQLLTEQGFELPLAWPADKFHHLIADDVTRWMPIARMVGVKLD
jgi:tripartite-type tricarboxylate transporter receptor subunit TctC